MTIEELLEALGKLDPAAEVFVSGNVPIIIVRVRSGESGAMEEVNLEPEGWE